MTSKCEWCDEPLTDADSDGTCWECDLEHNHFVCHLCEDYEHKDHRCVVGSLFVVFEPVPSRNHALDSAPDWFDEENHEMRPGIYRIVKWPIYGDAVLDQWLFAGAFEFVCDLTDDMKKNGGYAEYPCGPICRRCQDNLTTK